MNPRKVFVAIAGLMFGAGVMMFIAQEPVYKTVMYNHDGIMTINAGFMIAIAVIIGIVIGFGPTLIDKIGIGITAGILGAFSYAAFEFVYQFHSLTAAGAILALAGLATIGIIHRDKLASKPSSRSSRHTTRTRSLGTPAASPFMLTDEE